MLGEAPRLSKTALNTHPHMLWSMPPERDLAIAYRAGGKMRDTWQVLYFQTLYVRFEI